MGQIKLYALRIQLLVSDAIMHGLLTISPPNSNALARRLGQRSKRSEHHGDRWLQWSVGRWADGDVAQLLN